MLRKRKLVVCDLDGTLLNNKGQLSEKTIATVKKVTAQGHLFCIATGRPYRGAIDFYNQLGLDTIMCNFNGAYINNPKNEMFMPLNFTFSKDIAVAILDKKEIRSHIDNGVVECVEGTYMLKKPSSDEGFTALLDQFHITHGRNDVTFIDTTDKIKQDPNSILLMLKKRDNVRTIREQVRKISRTLVLREWSIPVFNNFALEINSIFASKGTAVKFLSAYYNIPLEDIYSFGDGVNDLEMLSKAGESFAMANASTGIKATAKFESQYTNDQNGVAIELERIFKI